MALVPRAVATRAGGALLALTLAACATGTAREAREGAPVVVAVVRDGDRWTADYRFTRSSPAWVLAHSGVTREGERPWRAGSWTVETQGVRLTRRGWYDVLEAANGGPVPPRVRVRFTPFAGDLLAEYDPALAFTDGSVALYSDQFDAFPAASAEAAARLPIDLNTIADDVSATRATFRDRRGRVLHAGERRTEVSLVHGATYVLFGPAQPDVTDDLALIVDPGLPPWVAEEVRQFARAVLARYADWLGPRPGSRPTVMVSWAGPRPGLTSMGGSVLPGLVVATFEGDGVLRRSPSLLSSARTFIAHEAAHFWFGQTVRYERSADAWITEGGADLLAFRAMAAAEPGYSPAADLQQALDDCVRLSAGRGVASAQERGEHRAYYACGAIFGLAAEAATGRPFPALARQWMDDNRADGVLTRAEWLAVLRPTSNGPAMIARIEGMLDDGADDPAEELASLLRSAGVAHSRDPDGRLRLS